MDRATVRVYFGSEAARDTAYCEALFTLAAPAVGTKLPVPRDVIDTSGTASSSGVLQKASVHGHGHEGALAVAEPERTLPRKRAAQMPILALHEQASLVLRICQALCQQTGAKQLQCSLGCGAPGLEEACWLQSVVPRKSLRYDDGSVLHDLALVWTLQSTDDSQVHILALEDGSDTLLQRRLADAFPGPG